MTSRAKVRRCSREPICCCRRGALVRTRARIHPIGGVFWVTRMWLEPIPGGALSSAHGRVTAGRRSAEFAGKLADGRLLFRIALPAQEIRIISGFGGPVDFGYPVDQRRLGVA